MCEALKNAGIVLRVGDMVYLRPEEVVEIILRVSSLLLDAHRSSTWTFSTRSLCTLCTAGIVQKHPQNQ